MNDLTQTEAKKVRFLTQSVLYKPCVRQPTCLRCIGSWGSEHGSL